MNRRRLRRFLIYLHIVSWRSAWTLSGRELKGHIDLRTLPKPKVPDSVIQEMAAKVNDDVERRVLEGKW